MIRLITHRRQELARGALRAAVRALGLTQDQPVPEAEDLEEALTHAQARAADLEAELGQARRAVIRAKGQAARLRTALRTEREARQRAEEQQAWAEVAQANLSDLVDRLRSDLAGWERPPMVAAEVVAGDRLRTAGHELAVTAVEQLPGGGSVRIQGLLEGGEPWTLVLASDAPVEVAR
ncbi:hypothetical protein [Streptomonospora nanhaiensis]|uniref:hypothetical protein n=1 Tax=Streptomonospora nanhaiensis TaxID=1323731 RepID=UPI001C38F74B|nr:hypothetical protein [Streptomonospora nanhaiensis]MBV2367130.1 hypothetical protein [Streptomonospora nanhaiensis]